MEKSMVSTFLAHGVDNNSVNNLTLPMTVPKQ